MSGSDRQSDRSEISDTVIAYATGIDMLRWQFFRSVFTERLEVDFSSFSGRPPSTENRDDWIRGVVALQEGFDATQHLLQSRHRTRRTRRSHVRELHAGHALPPPGDVGVGWLLHEHAHATRRRVADPALPAHRHLGTGRPFPRGACQGASRERGGSHSPGGHVMTTLDEFFSSLHHGPMSNERFGYWQYYMHEFGDDLVAEFLYDVLASVGDSVDDGRWDRVVSTLREWDQSYADWFVEHHFYTRQIENVDSPFSPLSIPLSEATVALVSSGGFISMTNRRTDRATRRPSRPNTSRSSSSQHPPCG